MDTTTLVAFIAYLLSALASIIWGLIYLVNRQSMPYHQEALGISWQQHDPRLQALLLGLMRTIGGAMIATGISVLFLLIFPFRAGESWVRFAIPIVGLIACLPGLYATIFIRKRTGAHTPTIVGIIALGLVLIGLIFSFI